LAASQEGRLEKILTMVYVVQNYWACFGLYPLDKVQNKPSSSQEGLSTMGECVVISVSLISVIGIINYEVTFFFV
jgi:hypothetical protein